MCDLPADSFVAGLALPGSADVATVHVSMRIVDQQGRVVVDHGGRLADEWRWSRSSADPLSFLYGASDGGGTYFDARPGETYQLRVVVSGDAPPVPRLVPRGGGWK